MSGKFECSDFENCFDGHVSQGEESDGYAVSMVDFEFEEYLLG